MSILSRTGTDTNDFILLRGTGTESIMQKVETTTTGDNPTSRANHNAGNYAFCFGERNNLYSGASGAGAFGGLINIYGENTFGFGYKVWNYENQSLCGGYNVSSYARESIVWGDSITITEASGGHSENPRQNAIFGGAHTISGRNTRNNLICGSGHTIGRYFRWSLICGLNNNVSSGNYNIIAGQDHTIGSSFEYSIATGKAHSIGKNVQYCNIFGGTGNTLGNYLSDVTVFGYQNNVSAGSSASSPRGDIYLFGAHLKANKSNLVAFGKYNVSNSDSIFEIGNGSSDNSRLNAFRVGYNSTDGYFLCINNVKLTATKLQQLVS